MFEKKKKGNWVKVIKVVSKFILMKLQVWNIDNFCIKRANRFRPPLYVSNELPYPTNRQFPIFVTTSYNVTTILSKELPIRQPTTRNNQEENRTISGMRYTFQFQSWKARSVQIASVGLSATGDSLTRKANGEQCCRARYVWKSRAEWYCENEEICVVQLCSWTDKKSLDNFVGIIGIIGN